MPMSDYKHFSLKTRMYDMLLRLIEAKLSEHVYSTSLSKVAEASELYALYVAVGGESPAEMFIK